MSRKFSCTNSYDVKFYIFYKLRKIVKIVKYLKNSDIYDIICSNEIYFLEEKIWIFLKSKKRLKGLLKV